MTSPFARGKATATARRIGRVPINELIDQYGIPRSHLYELLKSLGIKPGPTTSIRGNEANPLSQKLWRHSMVSAINAVRVAREQGRVTLGDIAERSGHRATGGPCPFSRSWDQAR
jgi:hypothetical protein